MNLDYVLIFPEYSAFVSGGNVYNKYFAEALSTIAHVKCVDWDYVPTINSCPATLIIDSLYLDRFSESSIFPYSRKILLLHYLDVFFDENENAPLIQRRIEQIGTFDYLIVTGQYAYDWLVFNGFKKEKVILLSPVLSIQGRKSYRAVHKPKKLLMVGNWVPVKGYLPFLQLLESEQPKDVELTILGDTTIDTAYFDLTFRLIDDSIYLKKTCNVIGTVGHSSVTDYFEASDLMVSASFFETFGMAIHEALSFGLPVIALNGGNIGLIRHPFLQLGKSHTELVSRLTDWINPVVQGAKEIVNTADGFRTWQALTRYFNSHLANKTF